MNCLVLFFCLLLLSCGKSPFLPGDLQPSQKIQGTFQAQTSKLQFVESKFIITPYWKSGPLIGDESKLLLILTDAQATPVDAPDEFKLMLWMPSMGHGSYPVVVNRLGVGIYEASEVYFTMEGDWDIHFQFWQSGNLSEEVKWSLIL
jgi:hypothetical protein